MGNSSSKPHSQSGSGGGKATGNGIGIASHPYQQEVASTYIHRQEDDNASDSASSSYSSEDEYLEPKVMFPDSPNAPAGRKKRGEKAAAASVALSKPKSKLMTKSMPQREKSQSSMKSQSSIATIRTGNFACMNTNSNSNSNSNSNTNIASTNNALNHDMIHRSAEVFEPHTTRSSLSYSSNSYDNDSHSVGTSDASCAKTVEFNFTDRHALKNTTNVMNMNRVGPGVNVKSEEGQDFGHTVELVLQEKNKKKKKGILGVFKKMKKKKHVNGGDMNGYESDGSVQSVGIRSRSDAEGGGDYGGIGNPYNVYGAGGGRNNNNDMESASDIQAASLEYYRQLHYRQQQFQLQQQQQLQLQQQQQQPKKSPSSWSEVRSLADDTFDIQKGYGNGIACVATPVIAKPPESKYYNMSLGNVGKLPTILDVSYTSSAADTSVNLSQNLDTSDIASMNLDRSGRMNMNNTSSMLGELTGENFEENNHDEDDEEEMESYLRFTLANSSKDDDEDDEEVDEQEKSGDANDHDRTAHDQDHKNDTNAKDHANININDVSMLSQEYTVDSATYHDDEEDTAYSPTNKLPFSCTKDAHTLDYTQRMNSFLEKHHASYVEGVTLGDIDTPTAKLGDLFENMNLTRHQNVRGNDKKGADACSGGQQVRVLDESYADVDDDGASMTLFRTSISVGENSEINSRDFQCQEGDDDSRHPRMLQIRESALDRTEADYDDFSRSSDIQETSALDRTSVVHDTILDQTDTIVDASLLRQEEVSVSALDRTDMAIELSQYHRASGNNRDLLNRTDMAVANENENLNDTYLDLLDEGTESDDVEDDNSPDELLKGCHEPPNASFDQKIMEESMMDQESPIEKEPTSYKESNITDDEDDSTLSSFQRSGVASTSSPDLPVEDRDHSPIPPQGHVIKAPTAAATANLLPSISQEAEEDEQEMLFKNNPFDNVEMKKPKATENSQLSNQHQVEFIRVSNIPEQKNGRIPPRGPEIGTIIKLVSKARKEEVSYCDNASAITDLSSSCASSAMISLQVLDNRKMAFSKQAATNSAFLFSDEPVRLCRQMPAVSKVDQQRLSLINIKEASRRVSDKSSTATSQEEEDPMETIRRLTQEKKNRAPSENRNQSVFISKKEGEFMVHNSAISDKVSTTQNNAPVDLDKQIPVNVQAENAPTSIPPIPEEKEIVTEFKAKSLLSYDIESMSDASVELNETEASNRNENDDTITSLAKFLSPTNKKRKVPVEDDNKSEIASYDSLAEVLDELSVTDLQKKYSAITPMKTKSPYVRFKKAIRVFEHNRPKTSSDHRKNGSPKKNASTNKKDFIFHQPKSSTKKKRRKLSGDTVKNRSTFSLLDNFESTKVETSNFLQKIESFSDENTVEEEALEHVKDSLQKIKYEAKIDTKEITGNGKDEESIQSDGALGKDGRNCCESEKQACRSPYDETDELNISSSSGGTNTLTPSSGGTDASKPYSEYSQSSLSMSSSPYSESSEEDIFADLRNDIQSPYTSSPEGTVSTSSPHRENNVLRSAMKKRGSAEMSNHRVSWHSNFEVHKDTAEESPSRTPQASVENSPVVLSPAPALAPRAAAVNPRMQQKLFSVSDEESIGSLSTAPPLAKTLAPVNPRNQQKMETQENKAYSPTSDSLFSLSPAPPVSNNKSAVNPRMMNVIRDKENLDNNVYSPTGDSLCSYSPLQMSSKNTASVTPSKMPASAPNALCLSPLQRTPMQARRWRALEAQAEQRNNKSSTKKRRNVGKRTPLGKLKIKS